MRGPAPQLSVWSSGRLGFGVNDALGQTGQRLVGFLLFGQRFFQELDRVGEAEFACPGDQRAIARNLVVLDGFPLISTPSGRSKSRSAIVWRIRRADARVTWGLLSHRRYLIKLNEIMGLAETEFAICMPNFGNKNS